MHMRRADTSHRQRLKLARVDRRLVNFQPRVRLAVQGELQLLPQRAAPGRVFDHPLFDIVQPHPRHKMHGALQVPALLAVQLAKGPRVLQHLFGRFELGEEVRYFGLDAAVARNVTSPSRYPRR
jgi:hypothetical protein